MESCCTTDSAAVPARRTCPQCGQPGRSVGRITLKALLKPEALERLGTSAYRFCPTSNCGVVYFGPDGVYERTDLTVSVFQKESAPGRTVCYCLGITEGAICDEIARTGRSTASERITALVKAKRCACEIKNPQGSCCLGNVAIATKDLTRPESVAAQK